MSALEMFALLGMVGAGAGIGVATYKGGGWLLRRIGEAVAARKAAESLVLKLVAERNAALAHRDSLLDELRVYRDRMPNRGRSAQGRPS